MCGIAGLIHRGKTSDIGSELLSMLQALKHRGPDSTGFAVYGAVSDDGEDNGYVMRFKVAEGEDLKSGFKIHDEMRERLDAVDARLAESGANVTRKQQATEYAHRYHFEFEGDMRRLADYLEDIDGVEILSIGRGLELIKDLGDANTVGAQYNLVH